MAVIERHRSLIQRLTSTGHPAGQRPKNFQKVASATHAPRTNGKRYAIIPNTARNGTNSRWSNFLTVVAVAIGAAIATWIIMGMPKPDISNTTFKKYHLRDIWLFLTAIGVIGFGVYTRYLINKAIAATVRKAWAVFKFAATGSTQQSQSARPKPAGMGQTVAVFVAVLSFANPIWQIILRKSNLSGIPLLALLPFAAFGWWAWRRHAASTHSS